MVDKYHAIHSYMLLMSGTMVSGDPHVHDNGADLWAPPGDITIIGCRLDLGLNPHPNSSLGDLGGCYISGDVSLTAKINEDNAILKGHQMTDPLELPTVGEHGLFGIRVARYLVMFPVGFGFDTDEWHPVYLNVGYRNFFVGGDIEAWASATVYYVERR